MSRPFRTALALCASLLLAAPVAAQPADTLLTVEEAIEAALARNYAIRIARNEARIAGNNYARGAAGYLPRVGLSAQQSGSGLLSVGADAPAGLGGANQFQADATASVRVFDGGVRAATYARLEALADVGRRAALGIAEGTLADVLADYYDVARQAQQQTVLRAAVALSEERLRITELRRDLGSASELEVRRARVDLNADRAALLRQEVDLVETRATLHQELGGVGRPDFTAVEPIVLRPNLDVAALRADVIARNRTLATVRAQETAARADRRAVRSEWWPAVDVVVGYLFNDLTAELGLPATRTGGFTYGLGLSFDVFEGFNRRRRLENAGLRVLNAELALTDTETALVTRFETTHLRYRNALDLLALEEENRTLAAANVEVALAQFRLGTVSSLELREVQRALTDAESRLVAARYAAKTAEIELLALSGRLLAEEG